MPIAYFPSGEVFGFCFRRFSFLLSPLAFDIPTAGFFGVWWPFLLCLGGASVANTPPYGCTMAAAPNTISVRFSSARRLVGRFGLCVPFRGSEDIASSAAQWALGSASS